MTNTSRGRKTAFHSTPGSTGAIFSEDRRLKPTPDLFARAFCLTSRMWSNCKRAVLRGVHTEDAWSCSSMRILALCNGI